MAVGVGDVRLDIQNGSAVYQIRPPDPEPGDLPVLTIDRDYSGMGDYPLSAEEFAAYDGGPWREGVELAARCAGGRQAKCRRSVSEAD